MPDGGLIAMPRRRNRARQPIPLEPFDVGPAEPRRRGEVMVTDAADPDNPSRTIRRARRVWAPDVLLAKGSIDQDHHSAATRFHNAYAVGVQGARDRLGVYVDNSGRPSGLADARLAAVTDYRAAEAAVGPVASAALSWCVLSHGSVTGWAECRGWTVDKASGYLLAALDRLAHHYASIKPVAKRQTLC